ncbi:MAG: FkbM family methyltransferase [Pyrinomonadaceae bacterium]
MSDLLQDLSFENICYLDIGANKPKFMNNTYLFYERGFRGVLVEPNSSLCEELREERPGDVVLNVGVGIDEHISEADFYMFSEDIDGLNTFSHEVAEHWENVGMDGEKYMIDRVVKVPLMNVNDIISNYFTDCPDFVSIDVEGLDLQVLETFDFAKYQPAIFCVETLAYNTDGSTYKIQPIFELLEDKGYFPYRETYANTIFANKKSYYDCHYQFARGNRVSDKIAHK